MEGALVIDPLTELVAIDHVGRRDAGVTVAFDEPFQHPEPELPRGGGLLDEAHIERAGEIDGAYIGDVNMNLGWQSHRATAATP